jgi:hypothetical protein
MSQVFHPAANTIAKVSIVGTVVLLAGLAWFAGTYSRSPFATAVTTNVEQPVPFSHQTHVGGDGISCLYCHTSFETSSFAGIPPTETCMTCHSQIWNDAPMLQPVRDSFQSGVPIEWNRVHDLPDFVYFNHSIHVQKGVGCVTCHGRVDQMPLMRKVQPMTMEWCLSCHREPERFIRPREEVMSVDWVVPTDQLALGRQLVEEYDINKQQLLNCSICHR